MTMNRYYLVSCNGYKTIKEVVCHEAELPRLCNDLMDELDDGYAVIAMKDGRTVADFEGVREPCSFEPWSHATMTGMYDRY